MFTVKYQIDEGFSFLETHIPAHWGHHGKEYAWTSGRKHVRRLMERAQQGLEAKVFTVMNIGDHWAPLCDDFTRRSISFDDSLDDGRTPRLCSRRLDHIKRWLSSCNVDVAIWGITQNKVQRLDVPRQPWGSGSCRVIALNTIERMINPSTERWSPERSAYHRLRYLELLTRPFEVRNLISSDSIINHTFAAN
ncbi:MAG: hypothetical protein J3Q66DRAFT_336825 [Benniella sp.]|nr:MAG: hypothetical protein J3Q66DRAFT_336825 [Benniella sp.]